MLPELIRAAVLALGAARAVIDAMVRAREHAEVARRVDAMERWGGAEIPPGLVVPDRDHRPGTTEAG